MGDDTLGRPLPGDVLGGKYRIVGKLGEGGVGVVYEAEHLKLDQRVAIKMLHPRFACIPASVKRFEREARATSRLRSPHVAAVLDVDELPDGTPFMVMELLTGTDLTGVLRERGKLPVTEAVDLVLQACLAMSAAHALGIVHRDLKPSNLFVAEEGNIARLKVVDFGISKSLVDDDDLTMTETSLGTPAYMSPEQIRSAKHVDARADVWSLGVILYRLLSGKLPFRGQGATGIAVAVATEAPTPIAENGTEIPAGLEAAMLRAMEKDVTARWQNVEALSEAIAPFGSGLELTPPPPVRATAKTVPERTGATTIDDPETRLEHSIAPPSRPTPARSRWAVGLAVAAALAVSIGLVASRRSPAPSLPAAAPSHEAAAPSASEMQLPSAAPPAPLSSPSASPPASTSRKRHPAPVARPPRDDAPPLHL